MNNYDTELMEMIKIKDHIIKGYEDNINFYHGRINDLQERLDKAIDYIDSLWLDDSGKILKIKERLHFILKGSDSND